MDQSNSQSNYQSNSQSNYQSNSQTICQINRHCKYCGKTYIPTDLYTRKSTCQVCHTFVICLHGRLLPTKDTRPTYKIRVTYTVEENTHGGTCDNPKFYFDDNSDIIDYQVPKFFEKNDFDVIGNLIKKLIYFEKKQVFGCCMRWYTSWTIESAKLICDPLLSIRDEMFSSQ